MNLVMVSSFQKRIMLMNFRMYVMNLVIMTAFQKRMMVKIL